MIGRGGPDQVAAKSAVKRRKQSAYLNAPSRGQKSEIVRFAEGVFAVPQFEIEEVLAILNDVLEGVQRATRGSGHQAQIQTPLFELLDQFTEVHRIPKDTRVRHDHEAAGPVQLFLELPLPILASTREEDVTS